MCSRDAILGWVAKHAGRRCSEKVGKVTREATRPARWAGRLTSREARDGSAAFDASVKLIVHDTFRAAWWTRTAGVLVVLAFTGDYIAPYSTPLGQVLITAYLAAYVGLLVMMRQMSKGTPLPRFMGERAREGAGS